MIHCFKKNKQVQKNKPENHQKTSGPSPRRLIASGQKRKQMPPAKKICRKGQFPIVARLHSARRQLFPPWLPSCPGSAQEMVIHCFKKNKQVQKNKPENHQKNKWPLSTEVDCFWPEKNKCPGQRKYAAKGNSLLSPGSTAPAGSFIPPGCRHVQAPLRKW